MLNAVLLTTYFVLGIFWLVLLMKGSRRYEMMIAPLDPKKYVLKALYPVGFQFLELIRYSYSSNLDKVRIVQSKIIWGERFGEYYYRVNVAEKFTYLLTFLAVSPLLGPLLGEPLLSLFGVASAGVMYYYADTKITDIIKKREFEISRDFADMVSKMALLINAGMITREAWEEISWTGEGALYEEMRVAVQDMNNGVSEVDAYIGFGNRCNVPLVKKFISMLAQNLSKGNKELVNFLKAETVVSWEEKKHLVRRQGEEAANKLMLPLGLILVGIFVMILVPIVSKIGI